MCLIRVTHTEMGIFNFTTTTNTLFGISTHTHVWLSSDADAVWAVLGIVHTLQEIFPSKITHVGGIFL